MIKRCIRAKFGVSFAVCEKTRENEKSQFRVVSYLEKDVHYFNEYRDENGYTVIGDFDHDMPIGTKMEIELCDRYSIDNQTQRVNLT